MVKALQGDGELAKRFNRELASSSKFWVGMALVTKNGLCKISESLERCLSKGASGRFLFGVDLPTTPDAIETLCDIHEQHKTKFEVRRFQSGRTFFHPKFSVFQKRSGHLSVIVGSSNLTDGGFSANYEANVFIDDSNVARQFLDYFEEHFEGAHAKRIDERWLAQYAKLWNKREKAEALQRKLRDKARTLGRPPANIPRTIKGHCFAFTGGIAGWPRKSRLYPFVLKRGGSVAKRAASMGGAECLVHAEAMGGRKTTKKLVRARSTNIPIITEEQFFKLAGRK